MEDDVFSLGRPNEWEIWEDICRFHVAQNIIILMVHKQSSAESWETHRDYTWCLLICWWHCSLLRWRTLDAKQSWEEMLSFILNIFSLRCLKDTQVNMLRRPLNIWDRKSEENIVWWYNLWVVIMEVVIETNDFNETISIMVLWVVSEFCR